jgi:hypothetical protein
MFLFRRGKLPSLKLAAGLFLFWSLVAGMACLELVIGYYVDKIMKHAGGIFYFTCFSATILACIHYAILRHGHTNRIERLALCIAIPIAITAVAGKAFQLHRENEIVRSLYFDWDKEFINQCETFKKEQRYAELVTLLEQKCHAYQKQVADLGGLKELVRMAGRPRGAIAFGTSDLFTGMHRYIDYNAEFTPMNVEFVLMESMPFRARETPQLQALAAQLSQSREPLLKAYGLWMLERHEEYRDFVYQYAERGEVWSYGFAADAANNDPEPRRALDMIDRYESELVHGPYRSSYSLHYLDFQIANTASKLGDSARDMSSQHRALIHRMLDRSLQTREGESSTNMAALFTLMGRTEDAERYLARIQHNSDKYLRAYMIEMLLEKGLSPGQLNDDTVRSMHQVLDEHLKTGNTPDITTEQIHRIFQLMGRGSEIENESR